jgi:hypothetical protein
LAFSVIDRLRRSIVGAKTTIDSGFESLGRRDVSGRGADGSGRLADRRLEIRVDLLGIQRDRPHHAFDRAYEGDD